VWTSAPGSRLDADYPENGVLIPRRNTGESGGANPGGVGEHFLPRDPLSDGRTLVAAGDARAAGAPARRSPRVETAMLVLAGIARGSAPSTDGRVERQA
jgi:hypothetical protein